MYLCKKNVELNFGDSLETPFGESWIKTCGFICKKKFFYDSKHDDDNCKYII